MPNVSLLTSGIGDVNLGGQLVPTGTVFAFAGTTAPSGWLLCDGTAYSQTDYAALFAVLGSTYNTQTNPTTNAAWAAPTVGTFRVPDYRGIFLRSSGQASGQSTVTVGGHQGQATAKNGLTNSSSSVSASGSTQTIFRGNEGTPASGAHFVPASNSLDSAVTLSVSVSGTAAAQTISGDSETRPINKGVLYIIKV